MLLVLVLLLLDAVAVTEQDVQAPLGVTTKTTLEAEPDCSEGIWQTTPLLLGELQVPELAVALLKVTPVGTVPLTTTFVAGSGPWLATVKVTVTWLPALTTAVFGDTVGAGHVAIHNSAAVPNSTTNALRVPLSVLCRGFLVSRVPLFEVVSPTIGVEVWDRPRCRCRGSTPLPPKYVTQKSQPGFRSPSSSY